MLQNQKEVFSEEFQTIYYAIPMGTSHLVAQTLSEIKSSEMFPNQVHIIEGKINLDPSNFSNDGATLLVYEDMYKDILNDATFLELTTFTARRLNIR